MGLLSNKISRDEIKPGDHIYSWRQAYIYAHHGIYVGDGKVVHFTRGGTQEIGTGTVLDNVVLSSAPCPTGNPCLLCGDQSRLNGVICSCLDCFLSGGDLYLFEYNVSAARILAEPRGGTCTLAASDSVEEVLHRSSFLLKNGFGAYHVFKNNCEDFAIYCKTGLLVDPNLGRSGQFASFKAAASVVISSSPLRFLIPTSFGSLTAVGYGVYCVSKYYSDIGKRSDVSKVPVERLLDRFRVEELGTNSNVEKEN